MRIDWRIAPVAAIVGIFTAGGVARADTWSTPIGVPRAGADGPASVYPATLNVEALGGSSQTGQIRIELHAVTHDCPEDLAVLLVHNNTDKYLLMSNAGGCRALLGTSIRFSPATAALPNSEPAAPAHDNFIDIGVSNYGTVPTFPAPAPPGPYTMSLPPANTNINGTWSLYVLDNHTGNRGVINGWSLYYDTSPPVDATTSNVTIPGVGSGPGGAENYPVEFDLTTASDAARVAFVDLRMHLNHTNPENLRMLLESPSGTPVLLMANAGGSADLDPGTVLRFVQTASAPVPDNGPIGSAHRPGGGYETFALGFPAPQPPYRATFEAFDGEPVRGTWRLWIYDDANTNTGELEDAELTISMEDGTSFELVLPDTNPSTADQPFVRIEATTNDPAGRFSYIWRTVANGAFYDAGAFRPIHGTNRLYADVPVRKGANTVQVTVRSAGAAGWVHNRTINVNEYTYSLAEGATGDFFDFFLSLANPDTNNAPITLDVLPEGGAPLATGLVLAGNSPLQLPFDESVNSAFSTIVHSTNGIPLAVERTMSWDPRGYGGHGGSAAAPHTRWLFAEGSQGFFHTYILLANNENTAANVTVTFLLEGGGTVPYPVTVDAHARRTIDAAAIPELANRSFGIDITSDRAIMAERAMYLPGARLFEGGHGSAGVNSTSTQWFLAEGATGPFFECFILMSNPNPIPANVTLTYLKEDGTTINQAVVIPANARHTINVETIDPQLANAAVSTTILSDVGIIAERSMYWPSLDQGWQEAHNSFGMTTTALRWGLADVRVGGPREHQTYVLLANPNPVEAEVVVRFLRTDAAPVLKAYTVAPTSRRNVWVNAEAPEPGPGTFSVDVQVTNYQPIAVEKALYWNSESAIWAGGTNVTATMLPPR